MAELEVLEEKIENLKWLIPPISFLKRTSVSSAISFIRKTAGILSKDFPKGAIFENNSRRAWKLNFVKRTRTL